MSTFFYTPNLAVLSDWITSLTVAFSKLRRISFVVENTFTFEDFDPQTNYLGMTVTNYIVNRARYLKIFGLAWFSLDISATVAAPLANSVTITLPVTCAGDIGNKQGAGALLRLVGGDETGYWITDSQVNLITFRRSTAINYAAGVLRIISNGFFEVK